MALIIMIIIIQSRVRALLLLVNSTLVYLLFWICYDYNWKCRVHAYRIAPPEKMLFGSGNTLYSSTNQKLFEKNFCNQSSHHENYWRFLLWIEAIMCILFVVSKDEWDTKEGTGKSMKSTFYEHRCLKRHLSGWSEVQYWKKSSPYPLPL